MIIYQRKIKIILWSILLLLQTLPIFIKVNVSLQLFFNSVILVYLGCLHGINIAENNIRKAEESEEDTIVIEPIYTLIKENPEAEKEEIYKMLNL